METHYSQVMDSCSFEAEMLPAQLQEAQQDGKWKGREKVSFGLSINVNKCITCMGKKNETVFINGEYPFI